MLKLTESNECHTRKSQCIHYYHLGPEKDLTRRFGVLYNRDPIYPLVEQDRDQGKTTQIIVGGVDATASRNDPSGDTGREDNNTRSSTWSTSGGGRGGCRDLVWIRERKTTGS